MSVQTKNIIRTHNNEYHVKSQSDQQPNGELHQRFNIVYIHTHDTGRMISPYNESFDTPHLQAFANRGTVLNQLFCVAPTCSPSRSGLLTGQIPHQNGMTGLAHRGFSIVNPDHHLCRYLQQNGYETVLCGIQHESSDPEQIGYDRVHSSHRHVTDSLSTWDQKHADAACDYLRERHQKPFFLSYGLVQTHRPFLELDDDISLDSVQVPAALPDSQAIREDTARYMTSVRHADTCIGRVLDTLSEQGLLDKTIVFYTTDHGAAFPLMKCTLSDDGIGVAGIIDFPGNQRKGRSIDAMLSHLDFYPTLCDLAGIRQPGWLQGQSFASLLQNATKPDSPNAFHEELFAEVTYHAAYEPQRCIRTADYKLIKRYSDLRPGSPDQSFAAEKPRLANVDGGLTKQFLQEQSLILKDGTFDQKKIRRLLQEKQKISPPSINSDTLASDQINQRTDKNLFPGETTYLFRYAKTLLFDLKTDPEEMVNLADHPDYAKIRKLLEGKLVIWQEETKDELQKTGYILPPVKATINRQICLEPDSELDSDYE